MKRVATKPNQSHRDYPPQNRGINIIALYLCFDKLKMEEISMQNLRVIEVKGQRVLTSKQLAECYIAKESQIKQNFSNNRERFVEGKHYISFTGDELRMFKNQVENFDLVANRTSHLYLWTEKGALLHAKSLNTDKAWEVYEYLVDFYFRVKETPSAEEKKEIVPVKGSVSKMEEGLPERKKAGRPILAISDPFLIFRTFLKVAGDRGITIKSCPFETCRSTLKGDVIEIRDGLTLREIDYELAWELAHSFIHFDGGDMIKSPLAKEYNAQATRAAEMVILIMETLAGIEKIA